MFGPNEIEVTVPSIPRIFFTDVFNPFYIFQLFSMILWYIDEYEIYASSILVTTVISIVFTVWTIRSARKQLRKIVEKHNSQKITAIRSGKEVKISSPELVPGDQIKGNVFSQSSKKYLFVSFLLVFETKNYINMDYKNKT